MCWCHQPVAVATDHCGQCSCHVLWLQFKFKFNSISSINQLPDFLLHLRTLQKYAHVPYR